MRRSRRRSRELLARVVYAESNTEPIEGQIAVAQVVLNRVRSESFPDTVSEVIYQERQFSTAPILSRVTPNETNYEAVDAAFETEVVPYDVLYFSRGAENDGCGGGLEHMRSAMDMCGERLSRLQI